MENKIKHGQFYTVGNCFKHDAFVEWFNSIPRNDELRLVEPFAGANNIIHLMDEAGFNIPHSRWVSYDIEPEAVKENIVPEVAVLKRDTLTDYPEGFDVCITNPPYLAKNSAKRKGLTFDFGTYSDLFEMSIATALAKTPYVAAIIPESFISREIFTQRLNFVISLNYHMFDDTEFPVCLAVFGAVETPNFDIYIGDEKVGNYLDVKRAMDDLFAKNGQWGKAKFNAPNGVLGLKAVDGTKKATIAFVEGDIIPSEEIKVSSRAITRIDVPPLKSAEELTLVIDECNNILGSYRDTTRDVFMTSFKGLRADGFYRRRLDFKTANLIVNQAFTNLNLAP